MFLLAGFESAGTRAARERPQSCVVTSPPDPSSASTLSAPQTSTSAPEEAAAWTVVASVVLGLDEFVTRR